MVSAREFGQRFGRSASWAKELCRRGVLAGAFILPNGEWRIPTGTVAGYVASLSAASSVAAGPPPRREQHSPANANTSRRNSSATASSTRHVR